MNRGCKDETACGKELKLLGTVKKGIGMGRGFQILCWEGGVKYVLSLTDQNVFALQAALGLGIYS